MKYAAIMTFAIFACNLTQGAETSSEPSAVSRTEIQRSNLKKEKDLGVGVKVGTLNGVSGKYWSTEKQAWEATLAFDNGNTALGADYLWHFRGLVEDMTTLRNTSNIVPFLGVGLLGAFGTKDSGSKFFNRKSDNFGLAARIPVGIEFLPKTLRLGVFAELGLGFGFVPNTETFITADLGARYYF